MEVALTLSTQILIMFLLMAIGVYCNKLQIFTIEGERDLNSFLVVIVVIAVILQPFTTTEYSTELLHNLFIALMLALLFNVVGIIISSLIYGTKTLEAKISILSSVYPNSGFMALPLLFAVFGSEGLFYGAIYIAVFNIFIWIHLVPLLNDEPKKSFLQYAKLIAKTPVVITVVISIFLFAFDIKLPYPIETVVSYIASVNTPLAMILLGIFVSKTNMLNAFTNIKIYKICAMKLVILPLVYIFILKIITFFYPIDQTVIVCLLISSGAPTAGIVSIMCNRLGKNVEFSIQTMALSTLLSLVTLPVVVFLAQTII